MTQLMFLFESSFSSLLKACGTETVDIADISSMSQSERNGFNMRYLVRKSTLDFVDTTFR
ncbi:unnamed protein product [Arabis nemorensis]|uniref:Uncharacterized protein n=1 Tax=Arabis nemorensis TaxID=586526 RepID=A0A565B3L5_9BRAS|nr:unnamed protein product [Arabis nemorensis]